ncbi:MAG: hypothetical protein FWD26_02520 [Treponema sp.]|nr:hypothetical protein [Treponema sp.]
MKKEQRTKTKEQRTMSKEQRIMKKTRKKPVFLSALCSLFSVHCSLFIALCSLLISCDVDPDFMKRIDEEVAWANAAKLNITIAFPSAWGVSNPGAGVISGREGSPRDIRLNHDRNFTIEFTPDPAFVLSTWLAYPSSAFDPTHENYIGFNWIDELDRLFTEVPSLGYNDVVLPDLDDMQKLRGGAFTFTSKTTEPVTLIPWCKTELRVTRTEPRNNPPLPVSRASDIIIYFNGSLNPSSAKFALNAGDDGIWITAKNLETEVITNINGNFNTPEYSSAGGFYRIIINPSGNLPPANSLIEVTVKGIENSSNEPMTEAYSFSWKTPESSTAVINSWEADYSETDNTIKIGWSTTGADNVVISYRVNNGPIIPLTNVTATSAVIPNIPKIDAGGVNDGQKTSGINEYLIMMELFYEGIRLNYTDFRIWNIPGMSVDWSTTADNRAIEINNSEQLTINNEQLGKSFVLMRDITLSNHVPIGTAENPFAGNFYGNGHTITINSFSDSTEITDYGLFGVVKGSYGDDGSAGDKAVIRDLTVLYNNVDVNLNSTGIIDEGVDDDYGPWFTYGALFGGITTKAQNTHLENVLVKGTVNISQKFSSFNTILIGGLAGWIKKDSKMQNAYGGLNININTIFGDNCEIGGIGGRIGIWDESEITNEVNIVEEVTVTGDIIIIDNSVLDGGLLNVGGLIGSNTNSSIKNSGYREGSITIHNGRAQARIGGAIGTNNGFVYRCYAMQKNFEFTKTDRGEVFVGGFVGYSQNIIEQCYSDNPVILNILGPGAPMNAGGFAGYIENAKYCYAKGDVSTIGQQFTSVGGFAGQISGNIENCYATGNISSLFFQVVECYIGGFAGFSFANIENCYATGNVFLDYTPVTGNNATIGGFVGYQTANEIKNCFAAGTVTAHRNEIGSNAMFSTGGFAGNIGFSEFSTVFSPSITNSAALGQSVTATGGTFQYGGGYRRDVGRFYGTLTTGGSASGNYAINTKRLYESNTYGDPRPPEITAVPAMSGTPVLQENAAPVLSGSPVLIGDIIAPVLSGTPVLSFNNITFGTISGLTVSDTGGSGLSNTSMSFSGNVPAGAPVWSGSSIAGIDLSALTETTHYINFDFTMRDNAGNTAVHRVEIKPNKDDPEATEDFTVTRQANPLSTAITPVSLSGLIPRDSNGLALASTNMTVTRNSGTTLGGSPVWNGSSITGIDLSEFTATTQWVSFDFNLRDLTGNTAVHRVQITPNRAAPQALDHFNVTVTPVSSNLLRSISGIFISDSGGSGIDRTTMTVTSNPAGVGGTPVWNGNSITGVDLSGLTANGHFLRFNFSLLDRAGNRSDYLIQLTRNAAGDFNFTGPTLQNTSVRSVNSDAAGKHGADTSPSNLRNRDFWTGTLGFSSANWDFSQVGIRGYPRLLDGEGRVLSGQ